MKLHHSPFSPFARVVTVTAHELGIAGEITLVPVEGLSPAASHAGVLAANPLGKIPALVTDHGHALHDSRVIVEYLCHHAGDKALLPDEPVRRFRLLTLQSIGLGLAEACVALRYETFARPADKRWPEFVERQRQRIADTATELDGRWGDDLATVNVGSIAVACALVQVDLRFPDIAWREGRPTLAAFQEAFAARASMVAALPG